MDKHPPLPWETRFASVTLALSRRTRPDPHEDEIPYQDFQLRPRSALYVGGLDLRIFDLFPNLEEVHFLNWHPFRVPYKVDNLLFHSGISKDPSHKSLLTFHHGSPALRAMLKAYLDESYEHLISDVLQKSILFPNEKPMPQIGMELFILTDMAHRGWNLLRVCAIEDPQAAVHRIRFQTPDGLLRRLIYTQADAYAQRYSKVLDARLHSRQLDLLFFKGFTGAHKKRSDEKALPERLFHMKPDALYVAEKYPRDASFGGYGIENYPLINHTLKRVGFLGGKGTVLGILGHFNPAREVQDDILYGALSVYQYRPPPKPVLLDRSA